MKRLLLLCLTAAVLVSCLGLSAQAAPTLSWTEFYTMGDAASAHTRIDPIELDGTTTLFLPASVSRKAVPVYFTLSEKPRLRGAQERRYAGPDRPVRGHG